MRGFTEAQIQNAEYRVGFACGDCGGEVSWNIARPTTSISAERSVVEGTRFDIVVDREEKAPLIIEVVVSHDLEATTKLRYEQAELPVFVVYPEWSTVAGLARAVIADVVINVPPMRCRGCQDAENRRQRELSEAQEWAQSMLSGLQAAAAEPAGAARPTAVRRWQYDKFGREIYPRVWRRVHRNAAILQRSGFVQSNGKPWLFRLQLPKGCGVVFANFGSTDEVAIWEDPSALIHWQLKERSDAEEHAPVQQLLQTCRAAGAEVRVSFYNERFDQRVSSEIRAQAPLQPLRSSRRQSSRLCACDGDVGLPCPGLAPYPSRREPAHGAICREDHLDRRGEAFDIIVDVMWSVEVEPEIG